MRKTEEIVLGDGKSYKLTTFSFGDFLEIEKRYGTTKIDFAKLDQVGFCLWLAIKHNHKDVTYELLCDELLDGQFLTEGGIEQAFSILSRLNGWDKATKNVQSPIAT